MLTGTYACSKEETNGFSTLRSSEYFVGGETCIDMLETE